MHAFFGSIFEFLFKYRPIVYQRGDFGFGVGGGWAGTWLLLLALLAAAPVIWMYTRARGRSSLRDRIVLVSIRVLIFAVVLFCLFRPKLSVKRVIAQQSYVAVLLDDSRSMRIADDNPNKPRTQFVQDALGTKGQLNRALSDRFKVKYFRFSRDIDRVSDVSKLSYSGTNTHVADAIDQVRQEMSGVPLAGVVVVSDGADNSTSGVTNSLLPMKASGVPIYTVGLGRESFDKDIQLSRVQTPARVLLNSALVVDVVVTQNGYARDKVDLVVEDDGAIVEKQQITLPPNGEASTVRVAFTAKKAGARTFTFRIAPKDDEVIKNNNQQRAVVEVQDDREKILYFEGEPRFELKFIRRAVGDDKNLHVVVLQRTAENKFLRIDIDTLTELAAGFPVTRDELFKYRAIILGSVEASFFTHDQLQMLNDFVSKRGGGLLALGGRHSFSEGGYLGTPVGEMLPVELEDRPINSEYFDSLKVKPTRAGLTAAATQIAATEKGSEERWQTLPRLTTANAVFRVKPGATLLLSGSSTNSKVEPVVLAYQHYGRGTSFALPVQDTWLWQMHADVPLEDQTHETFWRQLLRQLVHDVPTAVVASASSDQVEAGQRIAITAEVSDSSYLQVNDAAVIATVTPLSGEGDIFQVPLEWSGVRDGEYKGSLVLPQDGPHEIRIEAKRGDKSLGKDELHINAAPSNAEYFDAHLNSTTLKRMAEETGGRYYTPATASTLAEDISYTGRGDTVREEKDLWDMPALFLLLILLIGSEWVYRRVRGLA
jgi:uncharacterized membrane protein